MFVVRIISARVKALRRTVPDVRAVRLDGQFVRSLGILILTNAHVDVRRHVDKMSGLRSVTRQTISRRNSLLRMRSGLNRVNEKVIRAGMIRVTLNHVTER